MLRLHAATATELLLESSFFHSLLVEPKWTKRVRANWMNKFLHFFNRLTKSAWILAPGGFCYSIDIEIEMVYMNSNFSIRLITHHYFNSEEYLIWFLRLSFRFPEEEFTKKAIFSRKKVKIECFQVNLSHSKRVICTYKGLTWWPFSEMFWSMKFKFAKVIQKTTRNEQEKKLRKKSLNCK